MRQLYHKEADSRQDLDVQVTYQPSIEKVTPSNLAALRNIHKFDIYEGFLAVSHKKTSVGERRFGSIQLYQKNEEAETYVLLD